MSVVQMSNVLRHSKAAGAARLVLIGIADVANDDGEVTAYRRSHSIFAAKANVSVDTVAKAIKRLVELGELEVLAVGSGRVQSDYRISLAEPLPEPGGEGGLLDPPPAQGGPANTPGGSSEPLRGVQETPQGGPDTPSISPSLSIPPVLPVSLGGPGPSPDKFEEFWRRYPRRAGKGAARRAWAKAIKTAAADEILAGAARYASERAGQPQEFTAHPSSWLNAERWADAPGANRSDGELPRTRRVDTNRDEPTRILTPEEAWS